MSRMSVNGWKSRVGGGVRSLLTLSSWGSRQPWRVDPPLVGRGPAPRWRTVPGGGGARPGPVRKRRGGVRAA